MEGETCHDPDPISPECPAGTPSCFDSSFAAPAYVYATSSGCSVTGGFVYRGLGIPALVGRYIFGDLCSGTVWALREDTPGSYVRDELIQAGSLLTSFGPDSDGEIYVVVGSSVSRIEFDGETVPAVDVIGRSLLALFIAAFGALTLRSAPPIRFHLHPCSPV